MFIVAFKTAIIYLVLIILVHNLYIILKTNLTIPKIKDLVNRPNIRYEEIYNTINTPVKEEKKNVSCTNMKDELKKYLMTLSKKKKEPINLPIGGQVEMDQFNNYQTL